VAGYVGDWLGRQGGEPASDLDLAVLLVNSLDLLEDPADRLTDLAWFREVTADVGRADIAAALGDGDLAGLRELRESLRAVFRSDSAAEGAARLNPLLLRAAAVPQLVVSDGGARLQVAPGEQGLAALAARLPLALAELVAQRGQGRLGTCAALPCQCAFIDRTRAQTRRFCCTACNDRGQIHSDRSGFLAEATELASQGAVSLLPQGIFPWQAAPTGKPRDITTIRRQLAAFRACLRWLTARPYVDRARTAVVGHDYGAMYGALLASSDPQVHTAVLAAPDATWGHWFVKYWLGFTGQRAARYKALFAGLQPVRHVSRLGAHELFQWAGQDVFVSARVRQEFARQAPRARVKLYRTADHQLTDAAQADRDTFLEHELGLTH
jgi:predicted RNA-binding Zn ribbon-like protein